MAEQDFFDKIRSRHQIVALINLADCARDVTVAYRAFRDNHKDYYEANERFVFYTKGPLGNRTANYLRHAADLFDISRCFVAVYCGSSEVIAGADDIEIICYPVDSDEFDEKNIPDISTICALPWMHLEVMNRGEIKPCCFNNTSFVDESRKTLTDLFSGSVMDEIRDALYHGQKHPSCGVCWKNEDQGLESLRQWRTKLHAREFFTELLRKPVLKSFVLRPSTVCNFKCRICNDASSSQWAQENLQHEKNPEKITRLRRIISDTKWFDKDQDFMREIIDLLPNLEFLDIYGGEPLLNKQFYLLVQHSVENGFSGQQRLHFNTNGSVFPEDKIDLLNQFKEVAISLSIDDLDERFEYQRGGQWKEIQNNIRRFLECDPNIFKISVLATVSNLNLLYLDHLLDWAQDLRLPIKLNILHGPGYLRFDRISHNLRDRVVDKYQNHRHQQLTAIAANLCQIEPIDPSAWIERIRELDLRRGQYLADSHPELADLMGYRI